MKRGTFGIVEGFFSAPLAPWTHRERRDTIEFVSRRAAGVNCYFYCPKNDSRVTTRWESRYGGHDAREIRSFTQRCRKLGIETIYGLNPLLAGLSPDDTDAKGRWLRAVSAKLDHALDLGFEGVCLLFDDIPIAYDVADNAPLDLTPGEQMMIELVNLVYNRLHERVTKFWFCGPDYCFRRSSPLTDGLRLLDPHIGVVWTGNEIFVRNITKGDMTRVKRLLGSEREIIFWLNYPVNDCEQGVGSFNLGAIPSPSYEVLARLGAFLVNPMRECYANLPLYVSLSELARAPRRYQRDEAWQHALRTLFGTKSSSAQLLFDNFGTRNVVDDGPPPLLKKLRGQASLTTVIDEVRNALHEVQQRGLSREGVRFRGAIEQVLKNAAWFVKVAESVRAEEPISFAEMRRNDWFPTDITQARYAPEILRILSQRLNSLGRGGGRFNLNKKAMREIQEFSKRYSGQQKLHLKTRESARIVKVVQSLVRREQEILCTFLNDSNYSAAQRVRGFLSRSSCSRFSLS